MQLGKFGEHGFAVEADEQIGEIADGWIGGDATEAIGAAALESNGECGERRGCALCAVGFGECGKGLVESLLDERALSRMPDCAFWQPRLSTVAPATLG
jgi:hypothetical protein